VLADQLIEDRVLREGMGAGHARLVSDIRGAHRFDLSDNFAAAADEIMRSTPQSVVKAFPLARLPHRLCWLETAYAARSAFVNGQNMGEIYRKDLSRIGILLRALDDDGLHWESHLAWNFRTGDCSLCVISMNINLRDDAPPMNPPFPASYYEKGGRSRADAEALAAIANRTRPIVSSYHKEILAAQGLMTERAMEQLYKVSVGDWAGEQEYWIAAVALMNGRNVAAIERGPDMSKLSKARRRQGRPEPLDYSVCKIAPRILSRQGGASGDAGSVRAHFVRGHFKVRSSGIHWWSPHVRGDASAGFVGKRYEVA